MTLKEFKKRINNLKSAEFCYNKFNSELKKIYSVLLYYIALETVSSTGTTRFYFDIAVKKLNSTLNVPIEVYNIWGDKSKDRGDFIEVITDKDTLQIITDDKIMLNENVDKAYPYKRDNYSIWQNKMLDIRERNYRGILGNGYTEWFIDSLMEKISLGLKNNDTDLKLFYDYIYQYKLKVKEYIEKG